MKQPDPKGSKHNPDLVALSWERWLGKVYIPMARPLRGRAHDVESLLSNTQNNSKIILLHTKCFTSFVSFILPNNSLRQILSLPFWEIIWKVADWGSNPEPRWTLLPVLGMEDSIGLFEHSFLSNLGALVQ